MDRQFQKEPNNLIKSLARILIAAIIIFAVGLFLKKLVTIDYKVGSGPNSPTVFPTPSATPAAPDKLTGEKAVFGNMEAFGMQKNGRNYMVLSVNGVETNIDQANDFRNDTPAPITSGRFTEPKFSPNGDYLVYRMIGWEWAATKIYDIKKKVLVTKMFSLYYYGFTDDEKYFYDCESNEANGNFYGKIYNVPGFGIKYDLPVKKGEVAESYKLKCEYDKDKKVVRFHISLDEGGRVEPDKRVVEYSLAAGKAEEK